MNIRKLLISLIIFLGLSGTASATCSVYGKIERIYQNSVNTYVYMLPLTSLSSSYYYYFITADPELQRAIHAAKGDNKYVNVGGTATACPTNTGGRYGGVVSWVNQF